MLQSCKTIVSFVSSLMCVECRVRVSDDQTYFATCSNDGTVKMWECSRLDSRSATNRSRYTYNKQGGQIKTITFCDSAQCIAAASDSGAIHVFKLVPHTYVCSVNISQFTRFEGVDQIGDCCIENDILCNMSSPISCCG